MLRRMLLHPLTRDLPVDDPATTALRVQVLKEKRFLRRVYESWYAFIENELHLCPRHGAVVELGSGAGFLRERVPDVLTTEVFPSPGIRLVTDGQALPFPDASLRAIPMIDTFHHLPDCRRMLREAARCLVPGGRVIMIEPWLTAWSRWIYRHLHHEPCHPGAPHWEFPPAGPLSGANQALPWIVFHRDRHVFEGEFPELQLSRLDPWMPLQYLVSGGVSFRNLMPAWTYPVWSRIDAGFTAAGAAMFARIVLVRR